MLFSLHRLYVLQASPKQVIEDWICIPMVVLLVTLFIWLRRSENQPPRSCRAYSVLLRVSAL